MRLENDLYGFDKKLLIKAGDLIDRGTLKNIAGLSEHIRHVQIKDTRLMNDLIQAFKDKRYTNIFYPPETNMKIIRHIRRIKMPENILSELAHMKKVMPDTYHHILIIAVLAAKTSLEDSLKSFLFWVIFF